MFICSVKWQMFYNSSLWEKFVGCWGCFSTLRYIFTVITRKRVIRLFWSQLLTVKHSKQAFLSMSLYMHNDSKDYSTVILKGKNVYVELETSWMTLVKCVFLLCHNHSISHGHITHAVVSESFPPVPDHPSVKLVVDVEVSVNMLMSTMSHILIQSAALSVLCWASSCVSLCWFSSIWALISVVPGSRRCFQW